MEEEFVENIVNLYKENKWLEILSLGNHHLARKLLWVWPSADNLQFLKETCDQFGVSGITSIGCGCGLLEWILHKALDIPVIGVEVNEKWWSSKYSGPKFIDLHYPELPLKQDTLLPSYGLMFCYFNDGDAFKDYVRAYRGKLIFILGPTEGVNRYTSPAPFDPLLDENEWKLQKYQEVKSTSDYIAVYVRD